MEKEFKDGEHKWIWDFLNNHVMTRIGELRDDIKEVRTWQWKLVFAILAILGTLSIALILALLKILP